jgi:hypothetical protein
MPTTLCVTAHIITRSQFVAARGAGARAPFVARRALRPAADGLAAAAPFIIIIIIHIIILIIHGPRATDARDACGCERERVGVGAPVGGRGRGGVGAQSQVCDVWGFSRMCGGV